MKSIKARFTLLILVLIFVSVTVVGFIAIATAVAKSDEDGVAIINLTCENEALLINTTFESIEDSVNVEASYAQSAIGSATRFVEDESYRARFTDDMEKLFVDIAQDTEGAYSFYFRYNAETIASTQGFLYAREQEDAPFQKVPLTDISLYDEDDDEHVGWYYIPLRKGSATWLDPYQNKNLGIYMISYVVPVYVDGQFIGVIGMDVDFQIIIDQLQAIRPFSSGYAFLTDRHGDVLFHPSLAYGAQLDEVASAQGKSFEELLERNSNGDELVQYTMQGVSKEMAFQALRNGMQLVIVANEEDVVASRNALAVNIFIAALVIAFLAMVVGIAFARRTMRPFDELTQAARSVAAGDLNVELPAARSTEVKTLVEAYRLTVDRMRQQLDFINEMAHRDSLTALYNKSAYDERLAQLNGAIERGSARFAIVMVDVNNLKQVNDNFGHERGDEYLRHAVDVLRDVFGVGGIYRIGGDEFVVVVEGSQLDALEERLAQLEEYAQPPDEVMKADSPWEQVSVAYGASYFDPALDADVHTVFERADAAMYDRKRRMKSDVR